MQSFKGAVAGISFVALTAGFVAIPDQAQSQLVPLFDATGVVQADGSFHPPTIQDLTGKFDTAMALNADQRVQNWAAMARRGELSALLAEVETDLRSDTPHAYSGFIWAWGQFRLGHLSLTQRPTPPADLAQRLKLSMDTFVIERQGDDADLVAVAQAAMQEAELDYMVGISVMANVVDYGAHELAREVSYRMLKSYPNDFYAAWMATPVSETGIHAMSLWLKQNPDVANAAGGQLLQWRMANRAEQDIDVIDVVTKWLDQQPQDFYALRRLGIAQQGLGRFAKAAQSYAASDAGNPFFELAFGRWGSTVARQQDWDGALAIAARSAEFDAPEQRRALETQIKLAQIMQGAGENGRARAAYLAAMDLMPSSDAAAGHLRVDFADFLLDEGFPTEALELIEQDFEADPSQTKRAVILLRSLQGLGRHSDVIGAFDDYRAATDVIDDDAVYYLARSYNALGRPAEAAGLLDLVLDVAPEAYWMQGNIAYWMGQGGDDVGAFELAQRVAILRGNNGWSIRSAVAKAGPAGADAQADAFLETMLERYPYAEEVWKQIAKRSDSPQDVWNDAIERLPQLAFPVINLAKEVEGEKYVNWLQSVEVLNAGLDRLEQNGADRGQLSKIQYEIARYYDDAIFNGHTSSMDDLNAGLDHLDRARDAGLSEKKYWRLRQFILRRAGASEAYTHAALRNFEADPDSDDNVGIIFQGEVGEFLPNAVTPFLTANRYLSRNPRETDRLLDLAHRHEKWGGSPVVAVAHLEEIKKWDSNAEGIEERLRSAYSELGGRLRYHEARYHLGEDISSSERFLNWFEASRREAREEQPVLKTIDLDAMRVVLLRPDGIEEETHYDPVSGRVLYFRIGASELRVSYLPEGDLSRISVGREQFAELAYNTPENPFAKRVVTQFTTSDAPPISFKYNAAGKPVSITVEGMGTLFITYDVDNEIVSTKAVDLPSGPDADGGGVALSIKVTDAFQKLLELTHAVRQVGSSSFDILSEETDPQLKVIFDGVEDRYEFYDTDWPVFVAGGNELASALIARVADDPDHRTEAQNILEENFYLALDRQKYGKSTEPDLSQQDNAGIAAVITSVGLWRDLNARVRPEGLPKYAWEQWLEMRTWALAQDTEVPQIAGAVAKLRAEIGQNPLRALSGAGWLRTSKLSNPGFWTHHSTTSIFPKALVADQDLRVKDMLVRDNGDVVAISDTGFAVLRRGYWEWFGFDAGEQRFSATADFATLDASSHINTIVEDQQGRLWLGLKNGLAMLRDDYAMRPKMWSAGQGGLPRAPVEALVVSEDGLLAGGSGGLTRVDMASLDVDLLDDGPVLGLVSYEGGVLVLGRNGLSVLKAEGRMQLTEFQVTDAYFDRYDDGQLYVLQGKRLLSAPWDGDGPVAKDFSPVIGQEAIVATDAPYGLMPIPIFDDEQALAVLTDRGLSIYRDGGFEHLNVPDQDQDIPVRAVAVGHGQVYLATSAGLSAIETGQVQHDLSGRVYDLLTDASQGVTFVARGNGLEVVEHASINAGSRWFAGIRARELAQAPDGALITHDGQTIVRIARGTTDVQELFTADQTLVGDRSAGRVRSILAASDGSVWATAGASLFHWQEGQELVEYSLFKHDPAFEVKSDMLSSVFETVTGEIMLVASFEGHRSYRKDRMDGGLYRFTGAGFTKVADDSILGRSFVTGYTDLGEGTAIAGTSGGFSHHDGQDFKEFDLSDDVSYLSLKDRLPSLYLGTKGAKLGQDLWLFGTAGGVVGYTNGAWIYPDRLNWMLPGQEYASYGARTVHAVETDPAGRIYVGTDFGLTVYDPQGASAENFLIRQNRSNTAFEALERQRMGEVGEVLLDALPDTSDAAKLSKKLEKSRKTLADLERRLEAANEARDPQAAKLKKASMRAKQRNIAILAEMEAKAPMLFSMLQLNPLDLQSMSGRLPDDIVVAQYLPTADRLFINLVSNSGTEVREVEVTAEALFENTLSVVKSMALGAKGAEAVSGFSLSTTVTDASEDAVFNQRLAWLYDQLLRPIEHAVDGDETLVISPVGVLSNLPFNALVSDLSGEAPEYAVQSLSLAVAPSLYALDIMTSYTPSYSTNHVVFGDPDGTLPGARVEAEGIAEILEPDTVELRQGEEATYDELLFYADDARFLHLATHGKLDHTTPRNSYLLLAEGRRLTLPQIMTLPLENTDLVFLSACESGIGSEGLEYRTIAHAFAHAGAPAVVASFWQVEDVATKQLALAFYTAKMDGMENSAALAEAQRQMIRAGGENAHPNRWASFAVFGKP